MNRGGGLHSEHLGGIQAAQLARGQPARCAANHQRETKDHNGAADGHGDQQARGTHQDLVEPHRHQHAGEESEGGQDHRLLNNDPHHKAVAIAHGLHGGVFPEVIPDIGIENLVDDDRPNGEPHQNAEVEDQAEGCVALPVRHLAIQELLNCEHLHGGLEEGFQGSLHPAGTDAGLQLDHPQLDVVIVLLREVGLEVGAGGDH